MHIETEACPNTGIYTCSHDGIYIIPTISYIHPDQYWPWH
ncbi:hypothetical protein LCGC14_2018870, partial [marine sediment metagenome]